MKKQIAKFPWGPIIAWCAGLALPLGLMAWQQPTAMQATYLLMALLVLYGGGGLVGFFSSDWAQERWGGEMVNGSAYITPVGGNIFSDLGFAPKEAAKLKVRSQRIIAAQLADKARQRCSENKGENDQ